MQNYLIYQAISNRNINECRYSLLKYLSIYNLNPPADTSVYIFTPQPALFDVFTPFFHHFECVDHDEKVFKIQLLQHVFAHKKGNAFFCEPTTYPLQPLEKGFEKVEKGNLLLYQEPQDRKGAADVIASSAIIGINDQHEQTLKALDLLIEEKKDASTALDMELLINAYLQRKHTIEKANEFFADYHNFKEFSDLIQLFFKKNEGESIPNQVKLIHHLDEETIRKHKAQFDQLPLYKKLWHTLLGKGWSVKQYGNKF